MARKTFSLPIVLVLFVLTFSVSTSAWAQTSSTSMSNMTMGNMSMPQAADSPASSVIDSNTIPQQISNLKAQQQALVLKQQQLEHQQHLIQIQLANKAKNTFATADLPRPTLAPAQYDKIKNCAANQTMPAINSSAYWNQLNTALTKFSCGHVEKVFPNNNTALRTFKRIIDENNGFGNWLKITTNKTDPVLFEGWHFNNTIPGPTLRMTQGDHVRITIQNSNNSKFPHSFHMHSIHAGDMDGVTGEAGAIPPGKSFTFEFIARPYGVYPYHCHVEPVAQHIQRGLYGAMIIDPPTPRPQAHEMVMVLNGFSFNQINTASPNNDMPKGFGPPTASQLRVATENVGSTAVPEPQQKDDNAKGAAAAADDNAKPDSATIKNQDKAMATTKTTTAPSKEILGQPSTTTQQQVKAEDDQAQNDAEAAKEKVRNEALSPGGGEESEDNQIYAANSVAFGYTGENAIKLKAGQLQRLYLVNMLEFDPVNNAHLHGDMFTWNPSGTAMKGVYLTDVVTLSQGDRGIAEFNYHLPGTFMFHAHINRFATLGWMSQFNVAPASTTTTTNSLAPAAKQ